MNKPSNDEWASKVTTLRLGFLNIGPEICHLDVHMPQLTALFLQYNKVTAVVSAALTFCPNLKFLALQNNQIEKFPDLRYLTQLEFLDLSHNKLKEN